MERQFYTQFSKVEHEVCIIEFSRVTQRSGETAYLFIFVNLVDLVNLEVVEETPPSIRSFISPLMVEMTHDLGRKSQVSNAQVQYTFDVTNIGEDFLVKEKLSLFHRITNSLAKRSKEEMSIVSITTPGIIVLILAGVSEMLSKIELTRED